MKSLEDKGMLEQTMIIVCSDHGEEFLEHGGFLHGFTLFAECTEIPMVIYYPPLGKGVVVKDVVSLIDIIPTLAELLGVEAPAETQGVSLVRVIQGKSERKEVLSELLKRFRFAKFIGRIKLTTSNYSLIYRPRHEEIKKRSWLYDLSTDPGEQKDLSSSRTELTNKLTDMLLEKEYINSRIKVPPTRRREIHPETQKKLKALGYLR